MLLKQIDIATAQLNLPQAESGQIIGWTAQETLCTLTKGQL
jgi:hypothetical protein